MAPAVLKRPAGTVAKADAAAKRSCKASAIPPTKAEGEAPAEACHRSTYADAAESLGCPLQAYEAVMEGLALAEHLSESCREMLRAAVPKTLAVPLEQRISQQVVVVNMIEEALGEVAAGLQTASEAAEAEVAATEARKSELVSKVQDAEAHAASSTEVVQARHAALNEVASVFADAKMALSETRREHTAAADASAKASADLAEAEHIASKELGMLLEGCWEAEEEAKRAAAAVLALLGQCPQVEASLTSALPAVLVRKPSERGSFDITLMAECQQRFEGRVSDLKEQAQAASAASVKQAEILEAAQADYDAKAKSHSAAAEALVAAQAAHQLATEVLRSSWASVAEADAAVSGAKAAVADRRAKLADFQGRCLGGFEALKSRSVARVEQAEPMKVGDPATSAAVCAVAAGA